MKGKSHIIFLGLGVIALVLEFAIFKLDGIVGWFLTSVGVILIGIGLRNPIRILVRSFLDFL